MRPIDADALMEAFRDYMVKHHDREKCVSEENCNACKVGCLWHGIVKKAPTIAPESLRPQGEWKHKKHKIFGNTYEYVCSVCGCDYALAEYDYCPNCGAYMKGGTP